MSIAGNVLITGGSGTLGKAILRTATAHHWNAQFTIYSRSEYLQAQLRQQYPQHRYILGDVRDYDRLQAVIAGHDMVIHAAAMKRIPECEAHPFECYQTNVLGSWNIVKACTLHSVKRCIGISTDKACRAVTAYGASKLAMEKLFQANTADSTIFSLVRYGNVVASRGSVIPLWRQQAAEGQPLTITNLCMTRFWMTELDAVALIQLGSQLGPGEIIVPKMKSLDILDLAEAIAPGHPVVEVGLRSCEKLHEDLIHEDEPVIEQYQHYKVASSGRPGFQYSSRHAPRMSGQDFLRMIEETEEYEQTARIA